MNCLHDRGCPCGTTLNTKAPVLKEQQLVKLVLLKKFRKSREQALKTVSKGWS